MKISQSVLASALSQAIAFVPNKATLPVINHFYLATRDNKLTISATDLESHISLTIPCESGKEIWATTVPARLFLEIVNSLTDEITLRYKTKLSITSGESRSQLSTIEGKEFPVLPQVPDVEPLVFEIVDLLQCLANTVYAAAQDMSRPIITGVNFNSDGNQLVVSAADGYRMSVYKMGYDGDAFNVTIPAVFLGKMMRILAKLEKGKVKIYTTDNQALFDLGSMVLSSQLLPGAFVNIQQIIPKMHQTVATIQTKALKATLKTILILAKKQDGFISANFDTDLIYFSTQSPEEGNIEGSVEATLEGEPYKTALNGLYLRDAIIGMNGKICLEQNGLTSPLVVYPSENREQHITVIMPMQIRS